ncbi:MAG: DUF3891 family protein, partial [Chloroflexi bacterium]|nr:DUF3891 family protein [Chloroflexota bacterium]
AYQQCIDWLASVDPYAGLLVSRHRTGLWQNRYGVLRQPSMQHAAGPGLRPEIRDFIDRNEGRQREEVGRYPQDELAMNYRWLQVWDHLGLYFCCRPPREEVIDPVPQRYGTAKLEGPALRLTPISDWEVSLDPFPFDQRPLQLPIAHRRLPDTRFASQEAWLEAYYSAPLALLTYTLS